METMIRTIYAAGRDLRLRDFISAIRTAKVNPTTTYARGLAGWGPVTGAEILHQFRKGMHDRISQAVPYYLRGLPSSDPLLPPCLLSPSRPYRKLSREYQLELCRDAARLNGYGWFGRKLSTPEVRKRLGDHVHISMGGRVGVCSEEDCE
jgi:hypothetical protein